MEQVIKTSNTQIFKPKKYIKILAIVILLFTILIITAAWIMPGPVYIMGITTMNMFTESMQDTLPKDSIIFIKKVDPKDLKIGDDITFFVNQQTTITHRIINIFDNYDNSGMICFQTKGTNNYASDDFIVYESNVVGRVVYHIPKVGGVLTALHIPLRISLNEYKYIPTGEWRGVGNKK